MSGYALETYGCQMNLADSELIAGILEAAGWSRAESPLEADLIVVNTCSVRERAVERVTGRVASLASLKVQRPGLRIVVAGCVPQHIGAEIAAAMPDVDLFVGPDAYRRLPELLGAPAGGTGLALERDAGEIYAEIVPVRRAGIHAWLTIMRGCDRFCTYCAVPFGRGRERSLPAGEVVEAARQAAGAGFRAVTLLGQAVTSYRDGDCDFAALLGRVAGLPGLHQVRFLAPHPADFDARVLQAIERLPAAARHLHLPVQSGSNRVLAAMRRGYTREQFLDLVATARALIPGVAVTTDLIVGFPGETAAEFGETLDLMERVRFDSAFMFAYSPRPRTYAARRLADDVGPVEKQRRLAEMIDLQERHAWERFRAAIGARRRVLIEGPARGSERRWFGRAQDFKPVIVAMEDAGEPAPGDLVTVEILAATSHTLRGRAVAGEAQGRGAALG